MSPILYTDVMGILKPEWSPEQIQVARANYVWEALKNERWSYRKLAVRTGLSKSTVESRMKGYTPFLFPEIEIFANVLHRNPVELYSTLLALLPDLDSNQEPAGFKYDLQSRVSFMSDHRVTRKPRVNGAIATVTPLTRSSAS